MAKYISRLVGLTIVYTTKNFSIHEDNAGALFLADKLPPQFTPCSKYYASNNIWFQEETDKRKIRLVKINTLEQLGGIFTKGLGRVPFDYMWKNLMGC